MGASAMAISRPVFRTQLCDVLDIEYPILQSGMGGVAGPDLAAEVSNAGGLGIIAGFLLPPDQLRQAIQQVRARTDKPFGVNLLMPPEIHPPESAETIPEPLIERVQAALNPMRATLGIPTSQARPATLPNLLTDAFQVILDERVPVFSVGLGNPGTDMVAECHRRGMKAIAMVTTVQDALAVEATGLDAVVAQGAEAGGHRSHFVKPASTDRADVGTIALIPEVVDAVRIPVIAAGGIVDGRGLITALALGASGILMGSRFLVTRESMAPEVHKKSMLEQTSDTTVVMDTFSGRFARVLRNAYTEQYARAGAPVLSFPLQFLANVDIRQEATAQGNGDYLPLWSGQGVGLIRDLPGAGDVVEGTIQEARHIMLERLPQAVQLER
jgi:nitronate monooxygenase